VTDDGDEVRRREGAKTHEDELRGRELEVAGAGAGGYGIGVECQQE